MYYSYLKLLNWIFLVYQAHMEALLLSKDKKCMKLIRKLDSCISEKVTSFKLLRNIFKYNCQTFLKSNKKWKFIKILSRNQARISSLNNFFFRFGVLQLVPLILILTNVSGIFNNKCHIILLTFKIEYYVCYKFKILTCS